jgi:hypothetical protein
MVRLRVQSRGTKVCGEIRHCGWPLSKVHDSKAMNFSLGNKKDQRTGINSGRIARKKATHILPKIIGGIKYITHKHSKPH